ncbi:MAG TPA: hypothetical protein VFV02_12390 [Acidimicrobiales bacterium]|nr:hypothetical protein [Acidimicrobiales bacterium]
MVVTEEGLAIARAAGDKHGLCFGLGGLARTALIEGDFGFAESLLQEALGVARELADPAWTTCALMLLTLSPRHDAT